MVSYSNSTSIRSGRRRHRHRHRHRHRRFTRILWLPLWRHRHYLVVGALLCYPAHQTPFASKRLPQQLSTDTTLTLPHRLTKQFNLASREIAVLVQKIPASPPIPAQPRATSKVSAAAALPSRWHLLPNHRHPPPVISITTASLVSWSMDLEVLIPNKEQRLPVSNVDLPRSSARLLPTDRCHASAVSNISESVSLRSTSVVESQISAFRSQPICVQQGATAVMETHTNRPSVQPLQAEDPTVTMAHRIISSRAHAMLAALPKRVGTSPKAALDLAMAVPIVTTLESRIGKEETADTLNPRKVDLIILKIAFTTNTPTGACRLPCRLPPVFLSLVCPSPTASLIIISLLTMLNLTSTISMVTMTS